MKLLSAADRFLKDTSGFLSSYGLLLLATMIAMGGLAIDVSNAYRMRSYLQVTADAAAHAAIYTRDTGTRAAAVQRALEVVETFLPAQVYGQVITAEDIQFGVWDSASETFTPDPNSKSAVLVNTVQVAERQNSVGTYMLRLIGFDAWDVRRAAVFETYTPTCFREGFVAQNLVDLQSGNTYTNGFCIHSNGRVEVNSNNFFAENTVVSMPDRNDIGLPSSGFDTNDGLQDALRDGAYQIRILNRLAGIIGVLDDPTSAYMPDYITSDLLKILPSRIPDMTDFISGRIHTYTCAGGAALQIPNGTTLKNLVLVTDCPVKFGQGVVLDNVIVATTDTSAKSISAASGVQVGRDDHCAADGGSQLLTMGGIEVPADLKVYGGQLIAMGDITFSANANGIEGASFISGGTISGTSNMTMGFCDGGMERNFETEYFRLAI
ncbi:pilus assembly protein TadG-related protein [Actibacterium sp. MT2.3-13A]|uniref:pilus assembly protein TadG-related protein n=1 Tax=Actibacterium sp. MT2.3-13A TaxID=2828332 RepID=UPI001BA6A02B|nr:pilus assembly protein TadG-related protein [Actibacterium sp. MT2.3-13A]